MGYDIRLLKEGFDYFVKNEIACGCGSTPCVCKEGSAAPKRGVKSILSPQELQIVIQDLNGERELDLNNPDLWQKLYDYYESSMPYGTMKARSGDPTEFIYNALDRELSSGGI